MSTVYWTMKNGQKISVDDMDINHLRNTLKMIIRNNEEARKTNKDTPFNLNGDMAQFFNDEQDGSLKINEEFMKYFNYEKGNFEGPLESDGGLL